MAPILKLAVVASTASALAPASTPLVSRKLALQEFGIAAAGVLGGATLFAPPAEALTQEEKDALYQEFKAKKERKQDLRRANSYSDKARGENLAGALPDEDLAAKLADKVARPCRLYAIDATSARRYFHTGGQEADEVARARGAGREEAEGHPGQGHHSHRDEIFERVGAGGPCGPEIRRRPAAGAGDDFR